MKKYIRLSIGMIMCILLSACGSSAKADPIVLPATEDIISISVSDDEAAGLIKPL